jgi:antitoxin CptB
MIDATRLNRIRWRARRGLLENDIVLEKYFNQHAHSMSEDDIAGLDALLELSDSDLLDLVMARKELSDFSMAQAVKVPTAQVLSILRSIH